MVKLYKISYYKCVAIGYIFTHLWASLATKRRSSPKMELKQMEKEILIAVLSFAGTAVGSFGGMKLMGYRIEQLEKKVEKHNNVIERIYKLEETDAIQNEKIAVANHRIEDLEKKGGQK